jgi:hypothetical protein
MPAAFQNMQKTDYVAVDIGIGIFQGITYPGLRCQMADFVEMMLFKYVKKIFFIL